MQRAPNYIFAYFLADVAGRPEDENGDPIPEKADWLDASNLASALKAARFEVRDLDEPT